VILGYCSAKICTEFFFVFDKEQLFYGVGVFWDKMLCRCMSDFGAFVEESAAVPLCDRSD
jgi:hypothetical protein